MQNRAIRLLEVCSVLVVTLTATAGRADADPLVLADHGATRYSIVIAKEAVAAEQYAAKELAYFLKEMTGAEFPIIHDDAPASEFEIVLGNTSRKSSDQIPADLRTDNWEGFTLLRHGANLYIIGNIPRATLYGVYDLLEVELGCRFLTPEASHVPRKPTLEVAVKSRSYAPPFEYRCIHKGFDEVWTVRSRMNAMGNRVPMESMLGGVRWVGPFVHTMHALVPADEYFEEHPEYFALIDGKRRIAYRGHSGGAAPNPCMSHPDLPTVMLKELRKWVAEYATPRNPDSKYLVSVTTNDMHIFCKCDQCTSINEEEEGNGTKVRLVNAIASQLAREYPNVFVETFPSLTKITKPHPRVLLRNVSGVDCSHALDDPGHETNRRNLETFRKLHEQSGGATVYDWSKHTNFQDYFVPIPNLRYVATNLKIMSDYGVRGIFCQNPNSRGTQLHDLRYYVQARAMWRPDRDSRDDIEEFCRLFYGGGADDVLRYIDFLRDYYYGDRKRTKKKEVEGEWSWFLNSNDPANHLDKEFIATSEAILAAAEAKASTPVIKQRVATLRLPAWKLMLDRSSAELGRVYTFPMEWSFKIDPQDKGLEEQWQSKTDFNEWRKMRLDNLWTMQGEDHRGVGWYATRFEMPDLKGAPWALYFGAVDGDADIFIDGEKVAEQKVTPWAMWAQAFFRGVDKPVTPGDHTIVIRVYKTHHHAGIWKPIYIIDMSVPIPEELRASGRFVEVARAAQVSCLSEWLKTSLDQNYYPMVEHFLKHGQEGEKN